MNNPNPFVPQGSLQDQQSKRQSRMRLAVFCVLFVSVAGLTTMLIQGCNRKPATDTDTNNPTLDTNAMSSLPPEPTNSVPDLSSNVPPLVSTGTPPALNIPAPIPTPLPATVPPVVAEPAVGGGEYVVVHGDTLAKIAKKNGVSLKALKEANPSAQPTKLKVGQKLVIPAGGKTVADTTGGAASPVLDTTSGEAYVVKSGDTLTKIARSHGSTVRAIKAANGLTSNQIKVGQKLKVPSKAEAAAAPAPAPVDNVTAPLPTTTLPAPSNVNTPTTTTPAPVR